MNITRAHVGWKRALLYGAVVLLLRLFQSLLSKAGYAVANSFSYERLDPGNAFLWVSVHHMTELVIVLPVILLLGKLLKADFGLGIGDWGKGSRYITVFTAVFAGVTLAYHILMLICNTLPTYSFTLSTRNILGSLGFQFFLSGPTEELLYRALPITMLVYLFGTGINKGLGTTLETVIASALFAVAHIKWSLFPLVIEANAFPVIYAFALGMIQGQAYQDTHSILYPMFMHSISNVLMVGTGYLFRLL